MLGSKPLSLGPRQGVYADRENKKSEATESRSRKLYERVKPCYRRKLYKRVKPSYRSLDPYRDNNHMSTKIDLIEPPNIGGLLSVTRCGSEFIHLWEWPVPRWVAALTRYRSGRNKNWVLLRTVGTDRFQGPSLPACGAIRSISTTPVRLPMSASSASLLSAHRLRIGCCHHRTK
jgi:hypothetical protein